MAALVADRTVVVAAAVAVVIAEASPAPVVMAATADMVVDTAASNAAAAARRIIRVSNVVAHRLVGVVPEARAGRVDLAVPAASVLVLRGAVPIHPWVERHPLMPL